MAPPRTDTPVRRHERIQCRLPTRLRIAPADAARVRLSATVCDSDGWVAAELVDLSRGGAGLRAPVFVPKGIRIELRVSGGAACLDATARVQRTTMADARPTYLIGASFDEPSGRFAGEIAALLASLGAGDGVPPGA